MVANEILVIIAKYSIFGCWLTKEEATMQDGDISISISHENIVVCILVSLMCTHWEFEFKIILNDLPYITPNSHFTWMSWLHSHHLLAMLILSHWDMCKARLKRGWWSDRVIIGILQPSVQQMWGKQAMMSGRNGTNQWQLFSCVDLSGESKTMAKSCRQKFTKLTDRYFKQPQCHSGSPSKTAADRNQHSKADS